MSTKVNLGDTPNENARRDAVHVAVIPAVAGERLYPGSPVEIVNGEAKLWHEGDEEPPIGIVDPFCNCHFDPGERFWLLLLPDTITDLRHHWTHPAFDTPQKGKPMRVKLPSELEIGPFTPEQKKQSEEWLRKFIEHADCPTYNEIVDAASSEKDDITECTYEIGYRLTEDYLLFLGRNAHGDIPTEFWDHVEIVTGKKCRHRPPIFSCAC